MKQALKELTVTKKRKSGCTIEKSFRVLVIDSLLRGAANYKCKGWLLGDDLESVDTLSIFSASRLERIGDTVEFNDMFVRFAIQLGCEFNLCHLAVTGSVNENDALKCFDKNDDIMQIIKSVNSSLTLQYIETRPYRSSKLVRFIPKRVSALFKIAKLVKSSSVVLIRPPCPASIWAWLIAKIYRRPIVLYIANDISQTRSQKKKKSDSFDMIDLFADMYERWLAYAARVSELNVCLSGQIYDAVSSCRKITFQSSLVCQGDVKTSMPAVRQNEICSLIFIGRFTEEKGLDVLLDVMEALGQSNDRSYSLSIIGDGDLRPMLEARASSVMERFSNIKISFSGWLKDRATIMELLSKSDIFLLPSRSEGMPKVIFDAFAARSYVIATDVGSVANFVRNGETGTVVADCNASLIEAEIKAVMNDTKKRMSSVENAAKLVESYTIEGSSKKLALAIRECY